MPFLQDINTHFLILLAVLIGYSAFGLVINDKGLSVKEPTSIIALLGIILSIFGIIINSSIINKLSNRGVFISLITFTVFLLIALSVYFPCFGLGLVIFIILGLVFAVKGTISKYLGKLSDFIFSVYNKIKIPLLMNSLQLKTLGALIAVLVISLFVTSFDYDSLSSYFIKNHYLTRDHKSLAKQQIYPLKMNQPQTYLYSSGFSVYPNSRTSTDHIRIATFDNGLMIHLTPREGKLQFSIQDRHLAELIVPKQKWSNIILIGDNMGLRVLKNGKTAISLNGVGIPVKKGDNITLGDSNVRANTSPGGIKDVWFKPEDVSYHQLFQYFGLK